LSDTFEHALENILKTDSRYHRDAYFFLYQALQFTVERAGKKRHVSGRELLEGIREFAIEKYGPTSRLVFEHWGVRETLDFGKIVFNLIGGGLLARTEEDSIDDFKNGYDFKEAFEDEYVWTTE